MKSTQRKTRGGVTRSENMRRIKAKNTSPELAVRRMLFRLGYRYRIHGPDLAGKPDIVFAGRRKLIFVHGCFWHAHSCPKAHVPRTNKGYWLRKLKNNRKRDAEHLKDLKAAGWDVMTVWECEIENSAALKRRLTRFLGSSVNRGQI